ncbi:hypothetical protein RHS01_10997 [Rhizoctonia solani]|uniref:Uncharacterized protein n=1 Tax=Rhizoctonia solani TaxID=456999 RepID=A0A8H7I0Z1_9AGAM|nr:hypothetical protein RHS01_10997 [Rhizoctonia solani]
MTHVTSVEYLGIIVSDKGFSLDKLKIQAVQEWPTPTKVKESHGPTVTQLGQKGHALEMDTKEQEAFQGLKDAITNAPVLCHAEPSKPYFLETDASGAALGSILSQRQEDGCLHPLEPIFANLALITPEKELQRQIEQSLDQDKSLEEILQFLQNESKAPPSIKRAFKDYEMEAGLLFYQGRIVVPDVGTLRTDLLRIFHDSPLAGHPGRQQTLELVSRNYYWPGIRADTYWHVDSCKTCQQIRKPKYASIPPQLLELPSRPWQHVSYDMIVDLPKDGNHDSILVIVDSFTKYGIFVKCSKKLKAPELAELFLEHVWKRHGMPEKTISDRGRVFNNRFLRALYKRLGIDPHFSSAYHPQSDGQTERVNPSIKHFLRAYSGINQRDWTKWLPMAEFAYNNAVHSSTGKTPFKALYGWEPTLTPSNVPTDVPEADSLAQTMEAQWKEVESALRQSKQRMVAGEDGNPTEFEPKLTEQRLGPFKVIEKISDRAYRLELPPTMRIHNVFYVGLLSKVKRDKKRAFENRPPPVTIDGEEEYEVEGITDAEERDGKWFFRVKWKGYGSKENTWEPRENLKNAEKILEKYEKDMKKRPSALPRPLEGGSVVDTIDTREFIPIFSNLNELERTTFPDSLPPPYAVLYLDTPGRKRPPPRRPYRRLGHELLRAFDMRDLGPIHHFLGIAFQRDRKNGIITLNQAAYINSLVDYAGLAEAYPADTPFSPTVQLTRYEGVKPKFNYGTYIAPSTLPKGTPALGITYRRSNEDFGKLGYSDADWGSNLLDPKKQATVALSTMEAEYMALSHACTQAMWLRQFFEELQYVADTPTLIVSDNLAALALSEESQFHGRSKHIDIRHHFMQDLIEKRKVATLYVPTKENLANAFTKALPAPQFSYLMQGIMGKPMSEG